MPTLNEVASVLKRHHGDTVANLIALEGGYWSSAFAYDHKGDALVVRFGERPEGFEIDRQAHRFARPGLPIPEVLFCGTSTLGRFAISRRCFGRFLETAPDTQSRAVTSVLGQLLGELRRVRAPAELPVEWYTTPDQSVADWSTWLRLGLGERGTSDGEPALAAWRHQVAQQPELAELFQAAHKRVSELLVQCPGRRDLVHGDLLHQNVLIDESAEQVTGVFSWKCSALGDFVYDLAWCTFWAPWHAALDARLIYDRTLNEVDLAPADLHDVIWRHHCYEVQIAASHMGWFVVTDDHVNLRRLCDELRVLIERGPRAEGWRASI